MLPFLVNYNEDDLKKIPLFLKLQKLQIANKPTSNQALDLQ